MRGIRHALRDHVAVVTISNAPANGFGHEVRSVEDGRGRSV